jgi:WD40 repeat protein
MLRQIWMSLWVGALAATVGLGQGVPKEKPYLVLDSGGHTDDSHVVFRRNGREVVSVSYDRTIRIWDAASGTSLRTLHTPIGPGKLGMHFAVALAPDGETLAVAGNGDPRGEFVVYLIGLADGQIQRVLRGHTAGVICLAFDRQGERLASGSHDLTARVWNVKTGEALRVLKGHTKIVEDVAFSPQADRLLSASADETARIWDLSSGVTLHTLRGHTSRIMACDWSQDGQRLATGGVDQRIVLWGSDGKQVYAFDKFRGEIMNVRFVARDQEILFTARGGAADRAACLDLYKTGLVRSEFAHSNTVYSADISPDGRWVVSAGGNDSEIFVWQAADGKKVSQLTGRGKTTWSAGWHPSGSQIAWGHQRGNTQAGTARLDHTFSLETLERGGAPEAAYGGRLSPLGSSTLSFKDAHTVLVARGNEQIALQGFPGDRTENARCGTLVPERFAAIGGDYGLYIHDITTGKRVRSLVGHTSVVYSVAGSPNGRFLLSASNDQTLRIWAVEKSERRAIVLGLATKMVDDGLLVTAVHADGPAAEEGKFKVGDTIVALAPEGGAYVPATNDALARFKDVFVDFNVKVKRAGEPEVLEFLAKRDWYSYYQYRDEPLLSLFFVGAEWIAWTPEGYYAASPGGEHLIGWHVNNGVDKMANFYPAFQFRKSLYRPDVIKLLLKTGSVDRALEIADEALGKKIVRGTRTVRPEVSEILPPKVRLTTPDRALAVRDAPLEVRARASSVGKQPVTAMHLHLDGRPLPQGQFRIAAPKLGDVDASWTITLPPGKHRLAVRAVNAISEALSDEIEVHYIAPDPAEEIRRPSLYVLAIGISDYPGELKLNYAAADAQAIGRVFKDHSQQLYEKIHVKELTDKKATQREIMQSISWLKKQPTQRDVAILFFAGHGDLASDGSFYLMPTDVDPKDLEGTGVGAEYIKNLLTGFPCRVIWMLDACHAGGADPNIKRRAGKSLTDDLMRDLVTDERGVIMLCGSTGREFALESNEHRHGLFTFALVEGLAGKATKTNDGAIYLHHLDSFVTDRVRELSQGRQSPTFARPGSVRSFPLTRP